ncbi:MAG: glycosyltransferase [Prevotella sp.]|nr:glycosyltransferase [Prevotella sp.]
MDFSVLISIYSKEQPQYLQESLDSIFGQTLPPTEVVMVCDGSLTEALDQMIEKYSQQHTELKVIRLPKNGGLGKALQEGLKHCSYEIVARMDTDDICKPDRFETQIKYMEEHPETDVVGAWIDEFSENPSKIVSVRRLPEQHEDIVEFAKKRNPVNHPTAVFRRSAVEKAGSYRHFLLFEDYDLWVRMILNGARFHNIQRSLLYFRMPNDFFYRRGGQMYLQSEIQLQRQFHQLHYITWGRMMKNIVIRTTMRCIPNPWRKKAYLFFLRR